MNSPIFLIFGIHYKYHAKKENPCFFTKKIREWSKDHSLTGLHISFLDYETDPEPAPSSKTKTGCVIQAPFSLKYHLLANGKLLPSCPEPVR